MKELTPAQKRLNNLQIVSNQVAGAYSPEQIGVIQNNVAKGTSLNELAYFLNVCKTMELNPFNKEVWCYKDNRDNLLIFAGRDGFLSKAQSNPFFNGIRSVEVRENDIFAVDIINNKIRHEIQAPDKERGAIIYGVAIVFRKDGEPTIELADFKTYNKGYNAWKTHPAEMIKKVAETHALKKAFGISGIQSEYDFNINNGVAVPINTEFEPEDQVAEKLTQLNELFNSIDQVDLTQHQIKIMQRVEEVIHSGEVASFQKAIDELLKIKQ